MLSSQGMTAGESMRRSAPAPAAPPAADPAMDQQANPSVTITDMGDGTFTCDDGSGAEPSTHASLDEAMNYAKSTLGGTTDEMPMDDDATAAPAPKAPAADSTDLAGMYAKK